MLGWAGNASARYPSNLLQNPAFEDSIPNHWTCSTASPPAGVTFTWDSSTYRSGGHSASIKYENISGQILTGWVQEVPIQEGKVYEFSGYLKTESVSEGAKFALKILDIHQDSIANQAILYVAPDDWSEHISRFIAPAGSAWAQINLVLTAEGNCQAWFDDIYFGTADPSPVDVSVSASSVVGQIRHLQGMHGISSSLVPRFQEIGVDFVRNHDCLECDFDTIFRSFDADETLPGSYYFLPCDTFIHNIDNAAAEAFFRLGYSINGENNPPSDYTKWAEVCKHIVMHYNDGWADGYYYGIRYWEVWNEPDLDLFWTGGTGDFCALYKTVADTLKDHDSELSVGGSGFAGTNWRDEFLSYCRTNNVPLDFYSWHLYSPSARAYFNDDSEVRGTLDDYDFTGTESLQTEWNMFCTDISPEMAGAVGAAYTASALKQMQDSTISIATRYDGKAGGDISLFFPDGTPRKPFYAFLAMKWMLDTPIRISASDSDTFGLGYAVLAGKSEDGEVIQMLFCDYNSDHQGYNLTVNHNFAGPFRYERYLVDESSNLELVEDETRTGNTFFEEMTSPSIQLIRLTGEAGPSPASRPVMESGDYDGDGTSDIAVFRPSSNLWAVRGITRIYFGTSSDIPIPGDYSGDGTADIGIFRDSSGLWALKGVSRIYFGISEDKTVPGDYDGNGTWEVGVFRPDSALWAIRGITRIYFGNDQDQPVPADYNGDAMDDMGIFRAGSALWAIRGISRVYYGFNGDVPVTR